MQTVMQNDGRKNDQRILDEIHGLGEKLEINERIHKLELDVQSVSIYVKNDQDRYERLFIDQKSLIEKLDRVLFGINGDSGVIKDISSLKDESHERKTQIQNQMYWVWTVITGVIIAVICSFIIKG